MIERKILIGLITQTEYLRQIKSEWNSDFIESATAKLIAGWCWEYFNEFSKAPLRDIETIYIDKLKKGIDKSLAKEIEEEILPNLSDEYENGEVNVKYLIKQTKKYFKERQITIHSEVIDQLLSKHKIDEAVQVAQDFKIVSEVEDDEIDLSKPEVLAKIDSAFDTEYQNVISFPGALGEFWNDQLVRGALVGILAPEKRGKCLPGSQKILMSTGEELTIDRIIKFGRRDIISFDEINQIFVKTKISDIYYNGTKKIYKVTTKTGRQVITTYNHPYLTPNGWIELSDLKLNDFIAVPKRIDIFGNLELPEHYIKLIAYFIADGCTGEKLYGNTKCKYIGFTCEDNAMRKDFVECIDKMGCETSWNGIDCRVINSRENRGKHDKNFVLPFLKKYKIFNKLSYHKRIPVSIFKLNKEQLSLFLSILFSCDGWINKDGSEIGFCVANEILCRQVQSLLIKFGIVSCLKFKKNNKANAWSLTIRDYENIILFIKEIGFKFENAVKCEKAIKNKKPIYKSFLDKFPYKIAKDFHDEVQIEIKNTGTIFKKAGTIREQVIKKKPLMRQSFSEVKDTKTGNKYFNSVLLWDEITKIEYLGKEKTYDLTVEKHHNFIAENILVHNTFMLLEFMMRAYLQKRKVAFFQAGDMTEKQQIMRICIYLAKRSNLEKYCGVKYIPVQDCVKNQTDTCNKKIRECNFGIFNEDELEVRTKTTMEKLIQAYEDNPAYKPCYNCVEWYKKKFGAVWVKKEEIKVPLSAKVSKKLVERFFIKTKRSIKISTHVNGTLTISKINSVLKRWKTENDFVPDIILIDYGDLIVPEIRGEFRHQQNDIWKKFRGLSQEGDCLVVVPTQADSESYTKDRLGLSNFNEDKRKYGHVTAMYGLNQDVSGREKEIGIMRINKIVVREGDFHATHEVNVLQRLEIGRPFLGSFF
jgi:intein/homing endonuclease